MLDYRGDVVEYAGGLLLAGAVEWAEDHFHQVPNVTAVLLSKPRQDSLQQEVQCWIFHIYLIPFTVLWYFIIQFDQSLKQT